MPLNNDIHCRHCSLRIEARNGVWIHVTTGSVWCSQSGLRKAEPS